MNAYLNKSISKYMNIQYINTTQCQGPYSKAPPPDGRLASFGRSGVYL